MKNDKQRCGTRRYHQSEMKNPTTLISGTVTPKWAVPGERNLHIWLKIQLFLLLSAKTSSLACTYMHAHASLEK